MTTTHATDYDRKPWIKFYESNISPDMTPPRHANLPKLFSDVAGQYAGNIAFTTCMPNGMHGSLTYKQVDAHADAFAVYLRQVLGLVHGTRVALQSPNCLAYPVVVFGILKAGCVLVNTNPLYTPAEMEHQLRDSGAEALVIVDMFANKLEGILARTNIRKVIVSEVPQFFSPVPRAVIRGVMKYWNKALPRITVEHTLLSAALAEGAMVKQRDKVDVAAYTRDDGHKTLAALQYSGGTTGISKGVMLSHGNLLNNIDQGIAMGISHIENGKEVVLTALPLYHIFSFTFNMLCFYKVGARNILSPNPRPVQNLQRAFENYKITWISGVNTLFNALLNEEWFTAFPPRHLKAAVAGGAALQHAVAERWQAITGTRISEGYGLTETSPIVTFNPFGGTQKADSIGIPLPGTEVRLVDEEGQPVPPGAAGELIIRGPQVMQGYWNQDEETDMALKDGWLYSGDVATMDEDGYFKIVDRKKDMILVSGFNVYPNEVECVIAQMDEVLEVGVIGMPDAQTGEAVMAYVVLVGAGLSGEQIRTFCRTMLTDYKVPKLVEIRQELPKSPIGKVLRKVLRAEYMAKNAS